MSIGQIDRKTFLAGYCTAFKDRLSPTQVSGLDYLLGALEDDDAISDVRHAAYMLATVKHETADTFEPIDERGGTAYFDKRYGPGTAVGKRLGNNRPGDGAAFHGRGYVQLTGRDNYTKFANRIGEPLTVHPEIAKDRATAYRIMSEGMRLGLFTGKRLADYLNASRSDYVNARRIINGIDRADLIAGYAEKFDDLLTEALAVPAPPAIAPVPNSGEPDAATVDQTPAVAADIATVAVAGVVSPETPAVRSPEPVAGGGPDDPAVASEGVPFWKRAMKLATGGGISIAAITAGIQALTGLSPTAQVIVISAVIIGAVLFGLIVLVYFAVDRLLVKYAKSRPDRINIV